ncbi:M14 family zinc carboxypeptidase [Isoptericola sp. NPDC060257]|uniref:M14 family zinc carboxypeptidase n=1 Tax=Isoptericola sp. NPDC060257 TaxID=3347087 RepID=UPI00365E4120
MKLPRTVAVLGTLTLLATTLVGTAAADDRPDRPGRGPERDAPAVGAASFAELARTAQRSGHGNGHGGGTTGGAIDMPRAYPSQPDLTVYPPEDDDATDLNGTISHAEIAPRLTALMASSDRVSTQVVGRSTAGRDLYLVTVTAPESRRETAQQTRWREEIRVSPERAAADRRLAEGYKTPLWISANIHGNEWEGTDAAMQVIDDLATSDDAATAALLEDHRLYFSLTLNPDGRTLGTRATSLSLDANRDMITGATPESRSFVATAQALQPLYAADFHGYTDVLQVEPCGPPHGENYEYDLFIPHGYAIARQVEDDVVAAEIPGNTYYDPATDEAVDENTGFIKIPYRDTPSGWDDYPPIFTAQYAAFHGATTSTVELPKGRTGPATTPEDAAVNTAVAKRTMTSMIDYVAGHDDAMLADQIEAFRRGAAGEPKDALTVDDVAAVPGPDEWRQHWDVVDDQDPVDLPRAYVIPVGDEQRSAADAEALVDQLQFHGVEVGTLARSTRVGGTTYPRGSFVVDLHQPLRGLANALLDLGTDISARVPSMYDISAWSLSSLWGATVDSVGSTTDRPVGKVVPLRGEPSDARVPHGARHVAFDVAGVEDYRALNALLEEDVPVWLLDDGRAVVGRGDGRTVREVAREHDVPFEAATRQELRRLDEAAELDDLTVAYAGTQDDLLSLTELGFDDLVRVTAGGIEAGAATGTTGLEDADVLWVGSALTLPAGGAGRAAVQGWVDDGGSVVGRTAAAFAVAETYGLVEGSAVTGNRSGNGIVDVDTAGSSFLSAHPQDQAFVYPATWFTDLGEGTTAEQSYDADRPFLAGHWAPSGTGSGGPDAASGHAAVVSGEAESGARAVVFGTSVFFRTHPKGGLGQAAQALFWAASGD